MSESNVICPFCGEGDFDLSGLKLHLTIGWCEKFEDINAIPDLVICGLCGKSGGDKIPHSIRWPGERDPGTELVHAECEKAECARAHSQLSDKEREDFLRTL